MWDVLQMYVISPEMYKLRRWHWASLTGVIFYEWIFIGDNYITPYICMTLFQDQLFHNFAQDQWQDEKTVNTLVILFRFLKLLEEGGKKVFYLPSSPQAFVSSLNYYSQVIKGYVKQRKN